MKYFFMNDSIVSLENIKSVYPMYDIGGVGISYKDTERDSYIKTENPVSTIEEIYKTLTEKD